MNKTYSYSGLYCAECGASIVDSGGVHHSPWCSYYVCSPIYLSPPQVPPPIQYGWCCPKCNRVFAPTMCECTHCNYDSASKG